MRDNRDSKRISNKSERKREKEFRKMRQGKHQRFVENDNEQA